MKNTKKIISIFLLLLAITSVCHFNHDSIIPSSSSRVSIQSIAGYGDVYF